MAMRAMVQTIGKSFLVRHLKVANRKMFGSKYLLLTNCTISVSLSLLGDFLEQQYEIRISKEIDEWNPKRSIRMGISGFTVGFVCHHWYQILDKYMPKRNFKNVCIKIFFDQTICSPIYITVFFITLGVLERKTVLEVWEEMKEKAITLYIAEWTVWPPAQFINFFFVPLRYRILYDSCVSLGYDIYTSHVRYSKGSKKKSDS